MGILKINSRGDEVKKLQKLLHLIEDGIFGSITEEAVINFQESHNLVADGIVGNKTWSALEACKDPGNCDGSETASNGILKKSVRTIKRIIIHCTATPEGKDYSVATIRQWHTAPVPKGRGWSDIGYHYVIYRDGTVHLGRDVNLVGAHTANYNSTSIGIVYVGGLTADGKSPKDTRTDAQKKALKNLVADLKKFYPNATIHGHSEFANKACPCFNVKKEFMMILMLLMMMVSCTATKYVPVVETVKEVQTQYLTKTDTICLIDSIIRDNTTVIREVDSAYLAQFGIKLDSSIENKMKAYLVQQTTNNTNRTIDKMYIERDTVIHDSIPYTVYVQVPATTEEAKKPWWYFLKVLWTDICWAVLILGIAAIVCLIIHYSGKIAEFFKKIWRFIKK